MMEGDVSAIDLLARLVEFWREHFTGAIRFESEGVIKILYFKGGDILSASTNDRSDSVDELLLRAGKVTREHVKQALAKRKETETLGDALLNLGFITRKELTWGRRVQVISVIRSVRSWKTGTYTIVADYLPKREEGTLFPLQQILVELIVTEQDRSEFERALDGGSAVFKKAADFDSRYRDLGLNEDADAVAAQIDGERAASEVASFAGRDAFNVFKLLHAFSVLGLIERKGKPQPSLQFTPDHAGDDLLSSAGVADADDVWNPTAPGNVQVPAAAAQQPEPDVSEFGDAPTLEIPVMSLPPDPPPSKQRSVEIPSPPKRRPTQPQVRGARPVLTSPGVKKKNGGGSRAPIGIIVLLLLLGAGAYGGWLWWQKRTAAQQITAPATKTSAPTVTFLPPPATASTTSAAPVTSTTRAPEIRNPNVATSAPTTTRQPVTAASKPLPTPPKPTPVTTKPVAAKPEPPPSAPVTRVTPTGDKYADMAREYERTANGTWTVQFELVCQTASLAKAVEEGGPKVWFVPITYRGQSCYRVFWGHFNNREAAALAVSSIPRALRGPAPAIVRIP